MFDFLVISVRPSSSVSAGNMCDFLPRSFAVYPDGHSLYIMRWNFLSTPANAEAGPSRVAQLPDEKAAPPIVNRYEAMLKDEEKYQEIQYPNIEEVPGCMTLL